jgi:uncharacterized protein (TIGR01319 family)
VRDVKIDVLVAEIGSTTTSVNAFHHIDTDSPAFLGQGQAPTTVLDGDVRIGLRSAVDDLRHKLQADRIDYGEMLAASSAAGGLKMTVHGLVYDMTARAAKEAALGAGAIIKSVTAGKLRNTDIARIRGIAPNLILLAGGVDFGERDTALHNAEMLVNADLKTPVIYAGNVENQEEIRLIFGEDEGVDLYVVENVYPKVDELNIEPARRAIQDAFEKHIIHAPGMEGVRDMVGGPIIPTPGAVMECAKLLSECIGNLIVLDIGGATTDLHSVTEDSDFVSRILTGPEPKAKRTVEGDLGVYVNMRNVIKELGGEDRLAVELDGMDIEKVMESYLAIPKTPDEIRFVECLAREAASKALERHAGRIRYVYGPSGRTTLAEGKDLTKVQYIVGTGGALTRLPHRTEIMRSLTEGNQDGRKLYPTPGVEILVDNDYIMAPLGVLSRRNKDVAIKLLQKSLGINGQ